MVFFNVTPLMAMTGVNITATRTPERAETNPSPIQEPARGLNRDNHFDIDSRLPSEPMNHRNEEHRMRWEYATTPLIIHTTTQILNSWGDDGWELVTIIPGPEGGLVAYFKRPVGTGA